MIADAVFAYASHHHPSLTFYFLLSSLFVNRFARVEPVLNEPVCKIFAFGPFRRVSRHRPPLVPLRPDVINRPCRRGSDDLDRYL